MVYQQKKTETAVQDYNNLAVDYSNMMEFINSIPKDLYNDLVERYQEVQEVAQDLDWDLNL